MRSVAGALIDHALALGAPTGPETEERLRDIRDFLETQRPPRLFDALEKAGIEPSFDQDLIKRGKRVFDVACRKCHGFDGKYFGDVISVHEAGTDPSRFNSWTLEHAAKLNEAVIGLGVQREPMTKDKGYVALPLEGIWLRAPYLHNGSVPNLVQLLTPPKARDRTFYRGCDLYDVEVMALSPMSRMKAARRRCCSIPKNPATAMAAMPMAPTCRRI